MDTKTTHDLVLGLILYVLLPLWGLSGFVDWCCHRATKIEHTSGLRESTIHAVMGIQVGIPILLSLLCDMNVLVYLLCFAALVTHELVAHHDVSSTMNVREISIWETHAHNYLATVPFYLFALITVRNPDTAWRSITLDWSGQLAFVKLQEPIGGGRYLPWYLAFMALFCIIPYAEEWLRCLLARGKHQRSMPV